MSISKNPECNNPHESCIHLNNQPYYQPHYRPHYRPYESYQSYHIQSYYVIFDCNRPIHVFNTIDDALNMFKLLCRGRLEYISKYMENNTINNIKDIGFNIHGNTYKNGINIDINIDTSVWSFDIKTKSIFQHEYHDNQYDVPKNITHSIKQSTDDQKLITEITKLDKMLNNVSSNNINIDQIKNTYKNIHNDISNEYNDVSNEHDNLFILSSNTNSDDNDYKNKNKNKELFGEMELHYDNLVKTKNLLNEEIEQQNKIVTKANELMNDEIFKQRCIDADNRKRKQNDEQNISIFTADKSCYLIIYGKINNSILKETNVPIFFNHKYHIMKFMEIHNKISFKNNTDIENEYKLFEQLEKVIKSNEYIIERHNIDQENDEDPINDIEDEYIDICDEFLSYISDDNKIIMSDSFVHRILDEQSKYSIFNNNDDNNSNSVNNADSNSINNADSDSSNSDDIDLKKYSNNKKIKRINTH